MFAETFGSFTGKKPLRRVKTANHPKSLDGLSLRRDAALKPTTVNPTAMTIAS
jgi:hypothetical protein